MYSKNLNPQQKAAMEAPAGPLLIVAGAGTGKTRTLASRILHFIDSGVRPDRICAITFTNKAAREMAERVNALTMTTDNDHDKNNVISHSHGYGGPFMGTFHSLGARILRKEAQLLGRKPNFVIFDNHDSFDLIKKLTKKLVPTDKNALGQAPAKGEARPVRRQDKEKPSFFAQRISKIKNTESALEDLKESSEPEDKLALKIFSLYENRLKENNAFDFDDLIEKTVFLFKKHQAVLKKYQKKFDAVLVDEYQDLNPKQYELVRLLAGGHKNLSVVGDDEQMIYGWRYADLKIFLGFEKDWPGARVAFLEENYRSSGNIISAASSIVQNNQFRTPKKLWTKNETGSPILVFEADDEDGEAEWIAGAISTITMTNDDDVNSHGHGGHSVAILYRTNVQSRAIEQALIRRQIPYRIFGGLRFYERKEVKDVIAALRYAMNKNDEISRDRLTKNLSKSKFSELAGAIHDNKNVKPVKLIEIFLEATDYLDFLERNFINYAERQENIGELINFAKDFDSLEKFLEEVALVQPTDAPSAGTMTMKNNDDTRTITNDNNRKSHGYRHGHGENTINLMTIHLSKGLEFDRVFIAGCSEGLLPHARSLDNEHQLEEERRLMYVAMTRAKKDLHISFYDVPSRFLSEMPTEITELKSATVHTSKDLGDALQYPGENIVRLE